MARANPALNLPLDVKLMALTSRVLGWVFVGLCAWGVLLWVVRHPVWTVRSITVDGDVEHQSAVSFRAQLATHLQGELSGDFLTLDLRQVRALFESAPWVRSAMVRRVFPNQLRVTLKEHRVAAWWGASGSSQLVSLEGVVFDASPDEGEDLPELVGPADQSAVMWSVYQALQAEVATINHAVHRLELDDRGSWHMVLNSGAKIEMGRGGPTELQARVNRFTTTLAQLTERYPGAVESVDLRYPNGYALRVRGVSTVEDGGALPIKKPR